MSFIELEWVWLTIGLFWDEVAALRRSISQLVTVSQHYANEVPTSFATIRIQQSKPSTITG